MRLARQNNTHFEKLRNDDDNKLRLARRYNTQPSQRDTLGKGHRGQTHVKKAAPSGLYSQLGKHSSNSAKKFIQQEPRPIPIQFKP